MMSWSQSLKHSDNLLLDSIPYYFATMCKATSGRLFNSCHRLRIEYYRNTVGMKYIHECFCGTFVLTDRDTMFEVMFILQQYL